MKGDEIGANAAARAYAAKVDVRATVWNRPAGDARAGGDWSDVLTLSDHVVALTIGDVAGHGEPVASVAAVMRTCIAQALRCGLGPSHALRIANAVACALDGGTIVTALAAILDKRTRVLTFANAGHPPPLLLTLGDHTVLQTVPGNIPLGILTQSDAQDHVVHVPPNAMFVFYTDGISEHRRNPIEGEADLIEAARLAFDRPAFNDADAIARHVLRRGRSRDDAAAIGLRML